MAPRIHIHDLAPDIIEEIFYRVVLHATPSTSLPAPHSPRYRSPASPYAISHVCRQWRYIALGCGHLWMHLRVVKPRTARLRHLLEEWMNRAKSFPLHLSLHETDGLTPFATKSILSLFLNSVHKCKSFALNIRSDTLKVFDMTKLHIQQPSYLEQFSIWTNDHSERPKARSVLEILCSAPGLRSMVWSNPGPMRFKRSSKFWVNLRELVLLTPLHPENLPSVLNTCQALERLVITRPRRSPRCVTLPRLRCLAVTISSMDSLNWLTVPSLTDLEIVLGRRVRLHTITAMTDRSDARLRTLRVKKKKAKDIHFTRTEERRFLKMLRSDCFTELRELEVEQDVGVETLEFLTLPPITQGDRPDHLPYLKSVRLTLFPNSRLLDMRYNLDALLASRISASRDVKPHDYIQFSDEALDFVPSTPHLERSTDSLTTLDLLCKI